MDNSVGFLCPHQPVRYRFAAYEWALDKSFGHIKRRKTEG